MARVEEEVETVEVSRMARRQCDPVIQGLGSCCSANSAALCVMDCCSGSCRAGITWAAAVAPEARLSLLSQKLANRFPFGQIASAGIGQLWIVFHRPLKRARDSHPPMPGTKMQHTDEQICRTSRQRLPA